MFDHVEQQLANDLIEEDLDILVGRLGGLGVHENGQAVLGSHLAGQPVQGSYQAVLIEFRRTELYAQRARSADAIVEQAVELLRQLIELRVVKMMAKPAELVMGCDEKLLEIVVEQVDHSLTLVLLRLRQLASHRLEFGRPSLHRRVEGLQLLLDSPLVGDVMGDEDGLLVGLAVADRHQPALVAESSEALEHHALWHSGQETLLDGALGCFAMFWSQVIETIGPHDLIAREPRLHAIDKQNGPPTVHKDGNMGHTRKKAVELRRSERRPLKGHSFARLCEELLQGYAGIVHLTPSAMVSCLPLSSGLTPISVDDSPGNGK